MQNTKQVLTHEDGTRKTDPAGEWLPPLNYKLLGDIVAWAANDQARLSSLFDGEWEQDSWAVQIRNGVCRSSYCIAGQAVVQAGYGLLYEETGDEDDGVLNQGTVYTANWCGPQIVSGVDQDGDVIYEMVDDAVEPIEDVAQRVLGLTKWEAANLFYAGNDLALIIRLVNSFAERRGLPPLQDGNVSQQPTE